MTFNRIRRSAVAGAATALALALTGSVVSCGSAGADPASASFADSTGAGLHNSYDSATFPFLAKALDTGTSMIELDVWYNIFTRTWNVAHSDAVASNNNCVDASSPADIYRGATSKSLGSCLDDVKYWLAAHPGAGPITIKVEMKVGFQADHSMGPAEFDSTVNAHIGNILFRPADLMGGHASLDEAAKANAWPSRSALAGKVIMYNIPGTVELANPFDTLHTDVETAMHLQSLKASGNLASATTFPATLGATSGDPRTQYTDTTLRPWFVVFDGDAATYDPGIDTSFYDTNHYLLTMTDSHQVAPALDDTNPPVADAKARVAELAKHHATIASSDWYALPSVMSEVLDRG